MQEKKSQKCQNCRCEFAVGQEDLQFYQKIKVPPPTWCPKCRLARRMVWRNERMLYKRKCDAPSHSEELISIYSPEKKRRVYDQTFWWGDEWDPLQYGREYDFQVSFFLQFKKLLEEVPHIALVNVNPVNSPYCNQATQNKNSYFVIGGDFNENVFYAGFGFHCKDSADIYWVSNSELNYETIDCNKCSRLLFSRACEECHNSAFLLDCKNCNDCFGCVGLRNKSHYIFNVPYSKEEYKRQMQIISLGSYKELEKQHEKFSQHALQFPRRFVRMIRSINSTGDELEEAKNCHSCFDVLGGGEDSKFIWRTSGGFKDCYDCDHIGLNSELGYETSTMYPGNNVICSKNIFSGHHIQYSLQCYNSSHLFGCIGLRNKQYCILNKQYTKEEYEKLVPKII
ncbi:hypothetical protein D6779_11765, partial [Candidatus Parcubacteria bacterium]